MSSLTWPAKDPDEVLDYSIDWSLRLDAGDTVLSVDWIFPTGLTEGAAGLAGAVASVFVSGGTSGEVYAITCRITTAGGRTMEESVRLRVRSK